VISDERYVVLGLASVRSPWFSAVGRWATVGSAPIEFVKCMSVEEVRARLQSGRPYSALLVDAGLRLVDRDLLHLAGAGGCAVVVVGDDPVPTELGVAESLSPTFTRDQLLDALVRHSRPLATGEAPTPLPGDEEVVSGGWRGRLVAVAGAGGAGTSTVAAALAQGLAADVRHGGMVLLGDFALHADQALLHDVGDVVPGVPELVDAHRRGQPSAEEVRALTFDVVNRRYHLLLGLRRHADWTALRPRAFEAALDGLRRAFSVVVADTDADLEGEAQCGSVDVEERNHMARTLAAKADLIVVVGTPGVRGLHRLVRMTADYRRFGVAPGRILAVINRGPRSPRARAELCRALAQLCGSPDDVPVGPVFLPERRWLDDVHRDGARFPRWFTVTMVSAVEALLEQAERRQHRPGPAAIAPGSLGAWTDQEAAGQ
jgi:CO dehydrogenase nickel-insertion accessory protein CooC1